MRKRERKTRFFFVDFYFVFVFLLFFFSCPADAPPAPPFVRNCIFGVEICFQEW